MLAPAIALRQYASANATGWYTNAAGAWQAKAAANYTASKLDLSGNSANLSEGNGAVTWSADDGWQFAAAGSKFLYAAGVTFSNGDYTIMIQFAAVTDGGVLCGVNDTTATYSLFITPSKFGNRVRYNFGSQVDVVPQLVAGNLAIAGTDLFRDGTDEGNITKEAVTSTTPFGIGAVTRSAVPTGDSYISANIYAVGVWASILSAGDIETKAAEMAAI